MKSFRRIIPNLLTLANLACGLYAVIAIFQEEYLLAGGLFVASLLMDFLDGMTARMLRVSSPLGVQLDSLADLVSFGVAPGLLMYQLISGASTDQYFLETLSYLALMVPLLSAWRLARFNIDQRQTANFIGLPTPANAIMLYSIGLFPWLAKDPDAVAWINHPYFLSAISLAGAFMLIAPLPMLSLKFSSPDFKPNAGRYLLLLAVLISALILGSLALVFIIPLYLVLSVIFKPVVK